MSDQNFSQDSAKLAAGQQVITCVALIHKTIDGIPHVFLARRSVDKRFLPGKLELPGGHIDFGEDLKPGLQREVREELNVKINIGAPFGAFTYMNKIKGSHSVELAFFATFDGNFSLNPADHTEFLWLSLDDLRILEIENGADDLELNIVKTGLQLLSGENIDFGEKQLRLDLL